MALSPRLPSHRRSQYPPYQFIHNPRNSPHPGGGTGILHTSTLTLSNISYHSFSHYLSCAISSPFSRTFNTTLLYRPPSPSIDPFLDEFRLFLHTISPNTIILGDFNFPNPPSILSLNKLLTSFNLIQHVTSPTHVLSNILDLIIFPKTSKIITNHTIGLPFSDHFIILLNLSHPKPTRPLTTRTSRKIHNLPIPAFIADLSSLPTTTSLNFITPFQPPLTNMPLSSLELLSLVPTPPGTPHHYLNKSAFCAQLKNAT